MRIRILHVLDTLNIGGLENGVINLINNSDPSKFEHHVCCLRHAGPMTERLNQPNIEIFSINKSPKDYLLAFRLAKRIRRLRPQIVHARNWGTIDAVIAAKMAGSPCILYSEHGREASDVQGTSSRRNYLRRFLLRHVHHIVTVSDDIRQWLIDKVALPPLSISTIRNGVDTDIFCPAEDKKTAKRNLGFEPETILIGAVGRLDPVKNYHMLLKALELQKSSPGEFAVAVVGDGPQRADLEQFAVSHGLKHTHFLGTKSDIPRYLQAFDIFVQTSLAEGISNSILEAMACGLPIIATRVGGNSEILEDNRTATLVAPDDAMELARQIQSYVTDDEKRARIGRAARQSCVSNFSLRSMVSAYEALYISLARKSHSQK